MHCIQWWSLLPQYFAVGFEYCERYSFSVAWIHTLSVHCVWPARNRYTLDLVILSLLSSLLLFLFATAADEAHQTKIMIDFIIFFSSLRFLLLLQVFRRGVQMNDTQWTKETSKQIEKRSHNESNLLCILAIVLINKRNSANGNTHTQKRIDDVFTFSF